MTSQQDMTSSKPETPATKNSTFSRPLPKRRCEETAEEVRPPWLPASVASFATMSVLGVFLPLGLQFRASAVFSTSEFWDVLSKLGDSS